jgi:hypothetical protein
MALTSSAACTYVAAMTAEQAPRTMKNLLKIGGAIYCIAAAQTLYNVESGWQKRDFGYITATIHAFLAALALWRGYYAGV